jgi:aminodeoxyfutalosine deaminase
VPGPDLIHRLPKAELHLHLEGSVDAPTLVELSRRHPTPLPAENNRYRPDPLSGERLTREQVQRLYDYSDFFGFLMAFKAVTERLRTPEDYELITYNLCRSLAAQNVLHAEVYVSVGIIHWRGSQFAPLFAGMEQGRRRAARDFGISLLWLFDAVRNFGVEEAARVVETTIALRDQQQREEGRSSIVGIGLGGDEARGPAGDFREVYAAARAAGLRLTAHAGESAGAESVWAALNIGAERIGHGLHAVDDPELMEHLAETQVPIEVCLSSNVRTGCCPALGAHPLRRMFDAGLMVTLSTDDPSMFHTTLDHEYRIARDTFGFTPDQLRELARNSFEASFLPAEEKVRFLELCDRETD